MADDVPDLEDFSHLINQRFRQKPAEQNGDIEITTVNYEKVTNPTPSSDGGTFTTAPCIEMSPCESTKTVETPKPQFGGMRKGFLLGNKPKPSTAVVASSGSKVENMPYITKSTENEKSSLIMKEVQQQLIDKKSEWLTDDLLNTIQNSNDDFLSMLSNPEFAQVLAEFQANPQQAMAKYQNNKKIIGFFTKFAQIMGEHFTKLGAKKA